MQLPAASKYLPLRIHNRAEDLILEYSDRLASFAGELTERPLFMGFGADEHIFIPNRLAANDVQHAL